MTLTPSIEKYLRLTEDILYNLKDSMPIGDLDGDTWDAIDEALELLDQVYIDIEEGSSCDDDSY